MKTIPGVERQQLAADYLVVERALDYLGDHYREQPSLEQIAAQAGLSEYHFQRVFTRWVGISPKRFLQFLTKEHARELLDRSASVLEAAYDSGLSGPGRLHDLFVRLEAATPGEYKLHGAGMRIRYSFHPSPFGECLLALSERGICGLSFTQGGDRREALNDLRRRWTQAELVEDASGAEALLERVFWSGERQEPAGTAPAATEPPLKLLVSGTNFQVKVWEALLRIPPGALVTYQDIAAYLKAPQAARAVGGAVGSNPISYIIPCHRVIRKMGVVGGYRWGVARKRAILGWEMAKA